MQVRLQFAAFKDGLRQGSPVGPDAGLAGEEASESDASSTGSGERNLREEFGALPEFQSRGKFLAYLAETMKYLSMDLAKHNKTAKAGGNLKAVVPVEGEDPEAVFGTGNRIIFPQPSPEKIALSRAIDTLREDLREVVHLKYWNQMTDKEIGTAIGKKASEVQALWKQAKLQLEKELAGKGKSVAT